MRVLKAVMNNRKQSWQMKWNIEKKSPFSPSVPLDLGSCELGGLRVKTMPVCVLPQHHQTVLRP